MASWPHLEMSSWSDAAVIRLARPQALNALNEALLDQLAEAFSVAAADSARHRVILTGDPTVFAAGADLPMFVRSLMSGDIDRLLRFTRRAHALLDQIGRCPKPVVACVQGIAYGGGLELALACHAIVAAESARFCLPETGLGIYPGMGGTQRTPRRIGIGAAKHMIYTGCVVRAERALALRLIDSVTSEKDALDAAVCLTIDAKAGVGATHPADDDVADFFQAYSLDEILSGQTDVAGNPKIVRAVAQLRGKGPLALRLAEKLLDEGSGLSLEAGLALELAHLPEIFGTADALAGLSTLGKRTPQFSGR